MRFFSPNLVTNIVTILVIFFKNKNRLKKCNFLHQIWWWVLWITKFGDKYRDHFGESFLETKITGNIVQTHSPNSVMIFGTYSWSLWTKQTNPKNVQNRPKKGLFIKNGKYRFKIWFIHSIHNQIQFKGLFNIIFSNTFPSKNYSLTFYPGKFNSKNDSKIWIP